MSTPCRCGGALTMRRKYRLSGVSVVWQCETCARIHGPVSARDLRDIEPDVLAALPWAVHKKKPQPNSKRRAYNAALHSAHWKALRETVLGKNKRCKRDGPGCTVVPTELNHLHYETLGQETEDDVEASCWTCNQDERQRRISGRVLGSSRG